MSTRPPRLRSPRAWKLGDGTLTLRDGTALVFQPVGPADRGAVARLVERLSDESRSRRFHRAMERLSDEELAYLTELDHHDHEAILAAEPGTGEAVGVARYVRFLEDPELAEASIVVLDAWQGRGVGTALLGELTRLARRAGVRRFSALARTENRRAIELFERVGPVLTRERGAGTVEFQVALPEEEFPGSDLAAALVGAVSSYWTLLLDAMIAPLRSPGR